MLLVLIGFEFYAVKFVSFNIACNEKSHNTVKIPTFSNQSSTYLYKKKKFIISLNIPTGEVLLFLLKWFRAPASC